MHPAQLIAALLALSALGLVIWASLAMARLEVGLRCFDRFEGLHFDN